MRFMFAAIFGHLLLATAVLAQDARTDPAPPAAPADISFYAYGDVEKSCRRWTDGCRTCTRGRTEADALACSNIGIACQPAAITCTERNGAPPTAPAAPDEGRP